MKKYSLDDPEYKVISTSTELVLKNNSVDAKLKTLKKK